MTDKAETPFDSIESALQYVQLLREAIQEAQQHVEVEMHLAADAQLARRRQALQLVSYDLAKLASHMTASHRILNDLRTLRRLLLEERQAKEGVAQRSRGQG